MIVTFISQCEKNALPRTRRVLDAFANRIGERTWQTAITMEGLKTVRGLLKKTASKNTAVSCHWSRRRDRSELLWVVGKRSCFNAEGEVPVNTTQMQIVNTQWENNWHYLPLIKALVAMSALFHDWGKASVCFQEKLKANKKSGDPLRHEWISCLLLKSLINLSHCQQEECSDEAWLDLLITGELDEGKIKSNIENIPRPLHELPEVASLIAWLVLTHHLLPLPNEKNKINNFKGYGVLRQELFSQICSEFGYKNSLSDYDKRAPSCFEFKHGVLLDSQPWIKQLKKWSTRLKQVLPLAKSSLEDGSWRTVLFHSRLALMLGDHQYSSQDADRSWSTKLNLYANTDRVTKKQKQKLDEHLVGVVKEGLKVAHLFSSFENGMPYAKDLSLLKVRSPKKYHWQNRAVEKVKNHRIESRDESDSEGFFVVNMASTGCGKTIANAKIMRALSTDGESLRYVLALGLRTLTLQTGDAYRDQIGLDSSELAVLIGSKAVMELHQRSQNKKSTELEDNESSGSESLEDLLNEEIDFESHIPEDQLKTVLLQERHRKFLYAPVLVCTIDHIMAATETTRGGKYILPSLRLMSSDLVIDEVDDFDGKDLVAIGRLIHLMGMLGRKVMISSATIPPALAEGFFNAYMEGWSVFSTSRQIKKKISAVWVDEFNTQAKTIQGDKPESSREDYSQQHQKFIKKRVSKLKEQEKKEGVRRQGELVTFRALSPDENSNSGSKKDLENQFFLEIKKAIFEKHASHHIVDPTSKKRVSFGVVRMANIDPCIRLSRFLMSDSHSDNVALKVMTYHSRQVLLLRSEQEKYLDSILKRHEAPGESPKALSDPVVRRHIRSTTGNDIAFVLVATPVEEVGRDHDFDWAVIEPSSLRSIIQLSGRVIRHRDKRLSNQPNIALIQYNLRSLKEPKKPAYRWPGFEDDDHRLEVHDLEELLKGTSFWNAINAIPRIEYNKGTHVKTRLADLEHQVLQEYLTVYDKLGPEKLQGWLSQAWWLTSIPQQLNGFRESQPMVKLFLASQEGELVFSKKDEQGEFTPAQDLYGIGNSPNCEEESHRDRLWIKRSYRSTLEEVAIEQDQSIQRASMRYGEISFLNNTQSSHKYIYSDQFGLEKIDVLERGNENG